jgi:teichuronic acid biosynthesis glycosyltransferase TuaH
LVDREQQDVVFTLYRVSWAGTRARGGGFTQDRFAAGLPASPRVRRVVIADTVRSVLAVAYHRALRHEPRYRSTDRVRHVSPLRLARGEPLTPAAAARAYRLYDRWLARAARGMARPAVITVNPLLAAYAPLEWAGPVTYYAEDDLIAHHGQAEHQAVYADAYEQLRRRGTRVCAVSDSIIRSIAPTGPSRVVPNGVDPHEWASPAPPPAWFTELPRPRLLYVGTLDRRLEPAMLRATAERHPGGSIVLVGPTADPEHIDALRAIPNVHVRPRVDRRDVVALTSSADACLIPHARTQLTEGMSPLKLYEALAAGRPVAAADLPPMRGVHERVVLAADGSGPAFAEAVARALALGPAPEAERAAFVEANTWSSRREAILELALAEDGAPRAR